jgi:hypothetical protein
MLSGILLKTHETQTTTVLIFDFMYEVSHLKF